MAYIQPNSTVEFFPDIGLTDNYDDTIYFRDVSTKDTYFQNLTKITTVTSLSYVRENRGFIRVERPMSTMYRVGYMRYKNTNFENKWFYAFVKSVNYINNITTEVEFEMDVVMTWMGNFTLKQCFIERQHTMTDAIGANIAEEGLETGDYVCEGRSTTAFFSEYRVALYRTQTDDVHPNNTIRQGTYIPIVAQYALLTQGGVSTIQGIVDQLVHDNRGDEVLCMKLVPYKWTADLSETIGTDLFTVEKPYSGSSAWGGFTPKNKKLYCYPYKFLSVQNCEGQNVTYKYEYFNTLPDALSSGDCTFKIRGTGGTPEVNIMCYPTNYKGVDEDYENGLTMSDFPNIAWNIDGYKAYLAQRDSTLFGTYATSILGGAALGSLSGAVKGAATAGAIGIPFGVLAGGILGGGAGAIMANKQPLSDKANEIAHSLAPNSVPARFPNETKGNMSSNLMAQMRAKNFYFTKMCITKNYAMMIDHYFDMYGYAIRQHGIPNMNARPYYTFVKTNGCIVEGNLPSDDARSIENIFDHGVRFWNESHVYIGNYNVNNAPS